MDTNNIYAVIMAGGKGERFWPQSRASHPKQLLRLIGNLTLMEQTVERLSPLVKPENIIIITNQDYVAPMRSLLSLLPDENIIGEPIGRDTAPCVALATALVKARQGDNDSVMFLLPADHVINDSTSMLTVLRESADVAQNGKIVTIGVNPSFSSTGYGYIQCGDEIKSSSQTKFYEGKGFKEKPSLNVAEKFIKDGCYKWNSGMFVWSTSTIYDAFKTHAPNLAEAVDTMQKLEEDGILLESLDQYYHKFEKISIDYAIMEKVNNVVVAECSFDWDDVGSWTALRNQIRPSENNNIIRGLHVGIDSKDCIIVGDAKHLIATIDVEDIIIVHTEDATLICNSKSAQRIKEVVSLIGAKPELSKYL